MGKPSSKPATNASRKGVMSGLEKHRGKWRWRKTIDGVRHTFVLAAVTEQEAMVEVLGMQGQANLFDVGAWGREVTAYLAEMVRRRKLSQGTAVNRRGSLMRVGAALGVKTPRSVTAAMLEKWLGSLESGHEETSTPSTYRAHVKAFFKYLKEAGRIPMDPTLDLVAAKETVVLREVFLPAAEALVLFEDAKKEGDRDMEFILAMGFECGMRRGEISAARPEWVELAADGMSGIMRIPKKDGRFVRKGKEGSRREAVIPLSRVFLEIISRHGLPGPYLVKPEKVWEKWIYRYDFRKKLNNFFAKHGHPELTIHDMRRSFASNRVSNGVSIEKVANWMGIDVKTAWERYSRFLPADEQINQGAALRAAKAVVEVQVQEKKPKGAIERLEELAVLKERGLITPEEWSVARERVLGEI